MGVGGDGERHACGGIGPHASGSSCCAKASNSEPALVHRGLGVKRRAFVVFSAVGLACLVVVALSWDSTQNGAAVLFSIANDPQEVQAINQREEGLAAQLYAAEASEAKTGFNSDAEQLRVKQLEAKAAQLAQELGGSHSSSQLDNSPSVTQELSEIFPATTHQIPQPNSVQQGAGLDLHIDGRQANILSALSGLAPSRIISEPPVINIYVGSNHVDKHSQPTTQEAASPSETDLLKSIEAKLAAQEDRQQKPSSNEQHLLSSIEAKLNAQDREIATLLAARRVDAQLQSDSRARMQDLSQMPTKRRLDRRSHEQNIEAEIEKTLKLLTAAHNRVQESTDSTPDAELAARQAALTPNRASGPKPQLQAHLSPSVRRAKSASSDELSAQLAQTSAELATLSKSPVHSSPSIRSDRVQSLPRVAARKPAIAAATATRPTAVEKKAHQSELAERDTPLSDIEQQAQADQSRLDATAFADPFSDAATKATAEVEQPRPVEDRAAALREEAKRRLAALDRAAHSGESGGGRRAHASLAREESQRLQALTSAAGDAPQSQITGSIGDFLPKSLFTALKHHDLIRKMEGLNEAKQRREDGYGEYASVDSGSIFDEAAAPRPLPPPSAYEVEQDRLIRGLESAAGVPAAAVGKPVKLADLTAGFL